MVLYTIFGKHIEIDEEGNPVTDQEHIAYAKQALQGSRYTYYIKVGNSGRLHDPLGLYATREQSRLAQTRGKPELRFVKTNKLAFDNYISFLRTKNKAWFKNAEREM